MCVGEPLLSRLSSDSESPVSDDDYLEVYLLHVAILNGSLTPGSLPHSRFSFLKRRTVPGNIEGRGGGGERAVDFRYVIIHVISIGNTPFLGNYSEGHVHM